MKKENNKNEKKKININYNDVKFFVVGLLVGLIIMLIAWPNRIAKLNNGEEVLATINGGEFTANKLYNSLKTNYGINELLSIIDKEILLKKYPNEKDNASKYALEESEKYYQMYNSVYGISKSEFLSQYSMTEESFIESLTNQYYYDLYNDEYIKSLITDKEIDTEYKNVFGDKKIYLFSSNKKEDLESVVKLLKKGKSLNDIKKSNSDLAASETVVTYLDSSSYSNTFIKKLKELKEKKFTDIFIDESYNYTVIYLVSDSDTPTKEEAKADILNKLKEAKEEKDANLSNKGLVLLREEYKLDIKESALKKAYDEFIKNYK